jgi:biopolymer transport protein ExbB/TolQ
MMSVKGLFFSGGWTLGFLVALSVYSIALIWERLRYYKRSLGGLDHFLAEIRRNNKDGDLAKSIRAAHAYKGLAASVVLASLSGAAHREERKRQAAREAERGAAALEERLNALQTIAATAPFIGLFGTVIGVIRAFRDLAFASGAGPGVVAAGISEALVNTAAGLFVAIPAVVAFNHLARRAQGFAQEMDWISDEILEKLAEETH